MPLLHLEDDAAALDAVVAVLELVGLLNGLPGQLPGLANGHKARVQVVRDDRTEQEASRLDADDLVDLLRGE